MIDYTDLKVKAVSLRKDGKTYSEILEEISVAKSTLSLWLRDVGLTKRQKQAISEKKYAAQLRGGNARKKQRIEKTEKIYYDAERSVGELSKRELWLVGTALYWAEGAKEHSHRISVPVDFGNTDPAMIQLIIQWLIECCHVSMRTIQFALYIHESERENLDKKILFWKKKIGFEDSQFRYTYFKQHAPKTVHKNRRSSYNGLLRVRVPKSTDLNRKIAGWARGLANN